MSSCTKQTNKVVGNNRFKVWSCIVRYKSSRRPRQTHYAKHRENNSWIRRFNSYGVKNRKSGNIYKNGWNGFIIECWLYLVTRIIIQILSRKRSLSLTRLAWTQIWFPVNLCIPNGRKWPYTKSLFLNSECSTALNWENLLMFIMCCKSSNLERLKEAAVPTLFFHNFFRKICKTLLERLEV